MNTIFMNSENGKIYKPYITQSYRQIKVKEK